MIWSALRGHQAQVEMFRRAVARGRTAQAYLFVGPRGIGKRTFARWIAQCLFCTHFPDEVLDACGQCPACKQVRAGTHPDLLQIGCPPGKKELPIELMSGSPERRGQEGLCHDLSLRPMAASRRIAIIDDAELMNDYSANALLKTLEEPPPGAILFLMTPESEPILPTIRSRCQPVRFAPLSGNDLAELLLEQQLVPDPQTAREIAPLADGSLETAQELLEPEVRQLRDLLAATLDQTSRNGFQAAHQLTEMLEKLGGESAEMRRRASWLVRFAVEHFRRKLPATAAPEQLDRLGEMIDRCLESELHLRQAMPVPLCLEGLFDALARIGRGGTLADAVRSIPQAG